MEPPANRKALDQNPDLWESLYEQAITEPDPDLRRRRLQEAETAILRRARVLDREPGEHEAEVQALEEAASYIREMKLETQTDGVSKEVNTGDKEPVSREFRDPARDMGGAGQ